MPRLQLTNDEYDALYILLRNIGGDPEKSRRKHMQAVISQMHKRYGKVARQRPRKSAADDLCSSFDKNFYMVDGQRMYWRDFDGTIPNHEWNKP